MIKSVKSKSIAWSLLALSLFCMCQFGCGSKGDQPELGTVNGTVTLDGQPLVGVAVVFQPDNGRPSRGMTDAEGKYELIYIRQTKGAKVGPHRVEIAPSEEGGVEETEGDADESPAAGSKPAAKSKVPVRYNSKSELNIEVKSGANKIDFDLKSN
jgi:hypothetical protein